MSEPQGRVLIDKERIADRVRAVGEALSADLERERVALGLPESDSVQLILVMTGALVFAADLIRAMPVRMQIRPVTFSSYPGTPTSSQGLNVVQDVPDDLRGKRVVIEFEGVRQVAEVYLNGHLLGGSRNGFVPFGFDLTPGLKPDGPH